MQKWSYIREVIKTLISVDVCKNRKLIWNFLCYNIIETFFKVLFFFLEKVFCVIYFSYFVVKFIVSDICGKQLLNVLFSWIKVFMLETLKKFFVLWPKPWLEVEVREGEVTKTQGGHFGEMEPALGSTLFGGLLDPQAILWIMSILSPMISDLWGG